MRFWMVGWEKPKKSGPDGTTGITGLELEEEHVEWVRSGIVNYVDMEKKNTIDSVQAFVVNVCTWQTRWPSGGWSGTSGQRRPRWRFEDRLQVQSQTGETKSKIALWIQRWLPVQWIFKQSKCLFFSNFIKYLCARFRRTMRDIWQNCRQSQLCVCLPVDIILHLWFGRCRGTAGQGFSCWQRSACCRSPLGRWQTRHGTAFCLWWSGEQSDTRFNSNHRSPLKTCVYVLLWRDGIQ